MVDSDADVGEAGNIIIWLHPNPVSLWPCDPATHHKKKERTFQKVNAKSNKSVRVFRWKTIYTLKWIYARKIVLPVFNMKNELQGFKLFMMSNTRISKSNRGSVRVKQRDLNSEFQIHIFDVLEGAAHEWIMMMLMILIPNNINLMKKAQMRNWM